MWSVSIVVLSLLVCFCSAFSGTGDLLRFMNGCKGPEKVEGKFCATLLDNDVDEDGYTTNKDFSHDGILYSAIDGDVCKDDDWETVYWWSCRYGWSEGYGRYFVKSFSPSGVDNFSFASYITETPLRIPNERFLDIQYDRFLAYCNSRYNQNTTLDLEQCDEVRSLKRQDIKC